MLLQLDQRVHLVSHEHVALISACIHLYLAPSISYEETKYNSSCCLKLGMSSIPPQPEIASTAYAEEVGEVS